MTNFVPNSELFADQLNSAFSGKLDVSVAMNAGFVVYTSLASLNADLSPAANATARVILDSTAANNGYYKKVGASGTGSWSFLGVDPVVTVSAQVTPIAAQVVSAVPLGSDGYLPIIWDLDSNKVMDWSPIWGFRVFGLKASDLQAAINALSTGAFAASVVTVADSGGFFPTNLKAESALEQLGASTYLYNWNPAYLRKWCTALANVRSGTSGAKLMFLGDSTTAGFGSSLYSQAFPAQLVKMMNASFIHTTDDGLVGTNNTVTTAYGAPYDPRAVCTGAFAPSTAGGETLGGYYFLATAAGTLSFTPPDACDTADIYYYVASNGGTFNVNVDGGSTLATVNSNNASPSFTKATVSFTRGTHTININYVSGTAVYIAGIDAYDSTTPAVRVLKAGRPAGVATTFSAASAPWAPANALTAWAPNLVVFDCTVNDINNTPTSVAAYKTNMQAVITAIKNAGADVILSIGIPSNTANSLGSVGASYRLACYQLADSNGIPLIDLNKRFVTQAASSSLYYSDGIHLIPSGYAEKAQAYFAGLVRL